jgi:hypothetical protein
MATPARDGSRPHPVVGSSPQGRIPDEQEVVLSDTDDRGDEGD